MVHIFQPELMHFFQPYFTWLDSDIRPWSTKNNKKLEEKTIQITESITEFNKNTTIDIFNELNKFRSLKNIKNETIRGKLTYIIGNHDWLLNKYTKARKNVAYNLQIDQDFKEKFPTEKFWPDYKVIARHGDIYDNFNYIGNREKSSLGDAIVIELINKFALFVENEIGKETNPEIIDLLKELDNVKPITNLPEWVYFTAKKANSKHITNKIKKTWKKLVEEFFEIDFVKHQLNIIGPRFSSQLQDLLYPERWQPSSLFNKALKFFIKNINFEDNYPSHAINETLLNDLQANYVVYGHTHFRTVNALDTYFIEENKPFNKIYFNTGTWRKIHSKGTYNKQSISFISSQEMSFLIFYKDSENTSYDYEFWNEISG